MAISDDYTQYPEHVAKAVAALRAADVAGPYAIALGARCFTGVTETTEHGGYPVFEHLRQILDGPVVWAPAVDGAVVLSQRGGDFELTIGEDFSVGYRSRRRHLGRPLHRREPDLPDQHGRRRRAPRLRLSSADDRPRGEGGPAYLARRSPASSSRLCLAQRGAGQRRRGIPGGRPPGSPAGWRTPRSARSVKWNRT